MQSFQEWRRTDATEDEANRSVIIIYQQTTDDEANTRGVYK